MPPSEGQEPRALTVAAQAIEGRKCAETAKVHPDLRIVYNLAYGVLAGEAGRFSPVGDYTTTVFLGEAVFCASNHKAAALAGLWFPGPVARSWIRRKASIRTSALAVRRRGKSSEPPSSSPRKVGNVHRRPKGVGDALGA